MVLLTESGKVEANVQDKLLGQNVSVSTSVSRSIGSPPNQSCLMYEPTTSPKYGSIQGSPHDVPCSIQEDFGSPQERARRNCERWSYAETSEMWLLIRVSLLKGMYMRGNTFLNAKLMCCPSHRKSRDMAEIWKALTRSVQAIDHLRILYQITIPVTKILLALASGIEAILKELF